MLVKKMNTKKQEEIIIEEIDPASEYERGEDNGNTS